MHIDNDRAAKWLRNLLDGVENSNHAAEAAVVVAMDASHIRNQIIRLTASVDRPTHDRLLAILGDPHIHVRIDRLTEFAAKRRAEYEARHGHQ